MKGFETVMASMDYLSPSELELVEKAYWFAKKSHQGQFRKSGDPYFVHCEEVALILSSLYCDGVTIASGLLHDTVEDCDSITCEIIEKEFGKQVQQIVEGVTKLKKKNSPNLLAYQDTNHQKIFTAMAKDYRVILVKLADRLHNMRTLEHMRPDKQKRISRETMQVYVPIAGLLGLSIVKNELSDRAFYYINPDEFEFLKRSIEAENEKNKDKIEFTLNKIHKLFPTYQVNRIKKSVFSYYKKSKKKSLDELLNTQNVQIIAPNRSECYRVLEIIHANFRAIPNTFKDYYSAPKSNGYRALHTKILDPDSHAIYQIQILEEKVLDIAKYGIAAMSDKEQLLWYKDLKKLVIEFKESAGELMEALQSDLFPSKMIVFSPEGDMYRLPDNSCVLDYAYLVHTDIGNRAMKALINGKRVALNTPLKAGDVVYIEMADQDLVCEEWLDFAKTKLARKKIRSSLKEISDQKEKEQVAMIDIQSYNRAYLLSDIVTVLQQNNIVIHKAVSCDDEESQMADTKLWMDIGSEHQLKLLKEDLKRVRSVISVNVSWKTE